MSDTFKLYYYNANGRAVVIRAMLYASKTDFEDIKLTDDEWKEFKESGKAEYNELPVLEYKDKYFSQPHAIEIYLAKKLGYEPKNIDHEYQIYNLLDTFDDFFSVISLYVFPKSEEDKKRKVEYKSAFLDKLAFFLKNYEKKYIENGEGKYFFGDYFSLADIFLCSVTHYFSQLMDCQQVVDDFSGKLGDIFNSIKENELKDYFEKGFLENVSF
ncbi:MAG: glutathione S-transferase [archaeon]|nr:glutathione S-transferase [archaeon]